MAASMFLCCIFMAMSRGWCTTMEPEPGMYSTSMEPEPGMSSTEPTSTAAPSSSTMGSTSMAVSTSMANGTSGNGTTGGATSYQHTMGLTISISNLSGKTEAQLINELTTALQKGGDSAEVSIKRITVATKMGGLPVPFDYDNYITAFAQMIGRAVSTVQLKNSTETNYTSHSSGGRRLNTDTGDFRATVDKSPTSDVVTGAQSVLVSITITGLAEKLNTIDSTKYGSLNLTVVAAPGMSVVVETKITSSSATPPTDEVITTQITSTVDGATVTVDSKSTVEAPSTTSAPPNIDDNSASLASMLTFWVAMCTFLTN